MRIPTPTELNRLWIDLDRFVPDGVLEGEDDLNNSVPPCDPARFGRRCAAAASALCAALPLLQTVGPAPRFETLEVGRRHEGDFFVHLIERTVGAMTAWAFGPEDLGRVVESRRPRNGTSVWDRALGRFTARRNGWGGFSYVEPGAALLVAAIEAAGGATIFCCEGHPQRFYIDASPDPRIVSAFLHPTLKAESKDLPFGPVARISFRTEPRTYEERDEKLRELSERTLQRLGLDEESLLERLVPLEVPEFPTLLRR